MGSVVKDQEISVDELLKANAQFASHLYSFITPMSLNCAVQLGIPDAIHSHGGDPMTLSDLTAALPIHPNKAHILTQLMRVLTHAGYFEQVEAPASVGGPAYRLTPLSLLLLADHPFTAKPYVLFAMSRQFLESWMGLSRWFESGTDPTPFHTAHGMSLWERTRLDGELNGNINDAMAGDSRMVASVLVAKDEELGGVWFGGVRSLVDVGGGTGGMARALAAAYPEVECTVLDLPQVVEGLEGTPNLTFLAGDMFSHVPSTDVVMLKWVLHDWEDGDCVKILKKCRKAITTRHGDRGHGKVIIVEIIINEDDSKDYKLRQTQLFYDMQMMGILAGKERSETEWKKIFDDAEFTGGYRIFHVLGFRSLIEVYP
ncbi:hypothetical protein V2J09_010790 [Rumex salicifolius]